MITFEEVSKKYGRNDKEIFAVHDVSLSIKQGEIFGIIGFSGAGKSTLLRLVNLLERPTKGKIIVNGNDITRLTKKELRQLRRKIGMVFQSFHLFSSRDVAGNIEYPLKLAGFSKEKRKQRVQELLRFVGLEDKSNKYPEQLSGGQKQRVGIARALATSPDILICDEATSALDPETTEEILLLLKRINQEYGITIILITHEMQVIQKICDRVAVMEKGKVIEQGEVYEVFTKPKQKTTKNFIRSIWSDQLSPSLLKRLKEEHSRHIYQLIFRGEDSTKPIIYQTIYRHNLGFNIIYGSIHELQNQLFGNLIVELIGVEHMVEKAIKDLEKTVEVKELNTNERGLEHILVSNS